MQWPSCCCDAVENKSSLLFTGSDHGPQLYFQAHGRFDMLAAMVLRTLKNLMNLSSLSTTSAAWGQGDGECQLYGPPAADRGPWAMTTLDLLVCMSCLQEEVGRTRRRHRRIIQKPGTILQPGTILLPPPSLPLCTEILASRVF